MSPARRRLARWLGGGTLLLAAWQAGATAIVDVIQQGRAFSVASLHLHVGDTIRFNNEDEFDHQVYVQSPGLTFDSDEAAPGEKLEMVLTAAGTFEVRCHIHPRMRLAVVVDPP